MAKNQVAHFFRTRCISHRAATARGPEVRRECPMTKLTALLLLAANPGDATVRRYD